MLKCHTTNTLSKERIIINHNQNMSKYKNKHRLAIYIEEKFLNSISSYGMFYSEATYVFNYSSTGVLFQGICSCMMPMADIHNENEIGTC